MSEISRSVLFGKLDSLLFTSLESATAFCKLRGNPYVELAHWLHQLMQSPDGDLQQIVRHFALDEAQLARDIVEALDGLPRGASAISDLSEHIDSAVERAWVYGSLKFGAARIRGGHLLLGILKTYSLRHLLKAISPQFERINADLLMEQFAVITAHSAENAQDAPAESRAENASGAARSGESVLAQYAQDLTVRARDGEIDPVAGRDEEIRQIIDILMRRRQNNPLLTGEAGVGKTAVVEGLALRIVAGDVPPQLRDVKLCLLDIGMLQAGAGVKGEFEKRLQAVIDEVQSSPTPIILFIDEIHTLIGAGGAQGTGDAANLLKPALARGQLRTIGATTWSEYKKYIEKDPALTRRFQVVQVHEPSEDKALLMLRSTVSPLEQHHRVLLLDEAVDAAVRLSHRYIPARQLPDKAVALLDTACARVALSQHALPEKIESLEAGLAVKRTEMNGLQEESKFDDLALTRITELQQTLSDMEGELAALRRRQVQEQQAVTTLLDAERQSPERLPQLASELGALQDGGLPLVYPWVDDRVVAEVLSDWTGIPTGRMLQSDLDNALNLNQLLSRQIFGQQTAIDEIAQAVRISRAGIQAHDRPLGVFMLSGPSGVGKTETAFALAEAMYGGAHNLIVFNMSEFQESHTVSTLKGAPPGYVGYGKGGKLTEAVRRKPYSIVLLDEFDKAHPDIHEAFYQVFDKGVMEDGEGRMISFRQCFILMTSNIGAGEIEATLAETPDLKTEALRPMLHDVLARFFPAALLARMNVIPYVPLSTEAITHIATKQISRLQQRLHKEVGVSLVLEGDIPGWIAKRISAHPSRGRAVESLLQQAILPPISNEVLQRKRTGQELQNIQLMVENDSLSVYFD
ncbi:type VI secretion system ATPase TssH [Serratia marcescens]|uniref:type VI secretion system ATPase TssH n=1 Tax=Serratia marcescens TaxID=615 RepID=UPI000F7E8A29|nr:type VI secretion system ATPase TssH [Serratia marcescens]RTF96703.1 type VI secretion system ATPase TssH [Serratia marcescens]RTG52576.1 type VI secretion system ATPase TssH [Serratia marcescens]